MQVDADMRARRKALLAEHMGAESGHDVPGVMQTFAADTEMIFNGLSVRDHPTIAFLHTQFAFSDEGAIVNTRLVSDREHYTDDEIIVEGRLCGRHERDWGPYPATHRDVELRYVAFYRFDDAGKLISERVVMDFGPLLGS